MASFPEPVYIYQRKSAVEIVAFNVFYDYYILGIGTSYQSLASGITQVGKLDLHLYPSSTCTEYPQVFNTHTDAYYIHKQIES